MRIEINSVQRDLLLEILKARFGSLKEQIYHSTTSDFTDQLKQQKAVLKDLIEKVETAKSEPPLRQKTHNGDREANVPADNGPCFF